MSKNKEICWSCDSGEYAVDEWSGHCETCLGKNWCDKCGRVEVNNEGDLCDKCQELEDAKEEQSKRPQPSHREEPPMRDVPRWGNGY